MTTSCPETAPPPFACPSLADSIQATAALLPHGAAWPANDGGGTIARYLAWLAGLAGGTPTSWPAGYVQAGFVASLGAVRNWAEGRVCALKEEFFCASAVETLDQWNAEYGLPDGCDPFPDLCAKVAAFGQPRCDYWVALAATLGWAIECSDALTASGPQFGKEQFGTAIFASGTVATVVNITVHLSQSPAYTVPLSSPPIFGRMQFGGAFGAVPNIASLTCTFDRIVPAHLTVNYTTLDT